MNIRYTALIAAFLTAAAGGLIWSSNHYHARYLSEQQRADAAELNLKSANATITDIQTRQREVAALDAKYTQELSDAKAENDALQRRLINGGRVLVRGRCSVPGPGKAAATSGMGNDASVELSPVAGQNILGIRTGIISDQQKVKYLQEYITSQCLN